MKRTEARPAVGAADMMSLAGRWILGGLFVYMGLSKALNPVAFLKLLHEYQLVDTPWMLNSIAAALPWFEVFCGALLLAGVGVRGSALLLMLMLVPFTAVVLRRALNLSAVQGISFWSVKFDCGCGTGEVVIWQKMIENTALILLAAWLLFGRATKWCARFDLLPHNQPKADAAADA